MNQTEKLVEIVKEYNSYIAQISMFLHPNIVNAFMRIHNKLVKVEIEIARTYKPSKEIEELEPLLIRYAECKEKAIKDLMLKNINTHIKKLYSK